MAVNINIPIENAVTNGSLNPVTSNAVFDALAALPSTSGLVPYTGATQDVDLGEFELKSGQVEFDQTPTGTAGVAVMRWNDTDGTLDLGLKGGNVTLQVGQEQVLRVVNKTATNVNLLEANYQAVRVTGAQGQRLKVDLAQATTDNLSAETIGLVTETINNNQEGFITTSGLIRNINTTGSLQGETWADGDILYLSSTTAGQVTKVKPTAPNHLVIVGYVVSAHVTQGSIFVKVDNGYELDELHNVLITSVADNNLLQYDSATSVWKNESLSTAGIQPTLVSATNIKTVNGNSLLGSGDLVISGGGGSGIFGIPNASGVYTYYATLTLAMAAATSGQTIEMFADVVETGAVSVNLKNGVNINGNGHTYTLNNTGLTNCIQDNGVSLYCELFNIKFKRMGAATPSATASLPLYVTNAATQIINNGVSFESTFSLAAAISGKVTGGYFRGELSNNLSLNVLSGGILTNADFYSAVGHAKIDGTAINCSFRSNGSYGVQSSASARLINCTGYSTANYGMFGNGYLFNCIGYSTANSGIYTTDSNSILQNCTGYSTAVCGLQGFGDFINSVGESTANAGIFGTSIINCTAKSSGAKAAWVSLKMYNSTAICTWNNASGHSVELQANNTEIVECVLQVTNSSANSIFSSSVFTSKYANNAFKGATNSINANVIQGLINIHDLQGNIII